MWSPGSTVMLLIVSDGAGTSSHHAEYEAAPVESTSCSVPVWISVESVAVQPASMQPPPIPIQSEESSAWPAVCCGRGRNGPVTGDRVEQLASLLECSLAVTEPVAARVRVRLQVRREAQQLTMGRERSGCACRCNPAGCQRHRQNCNQALDRAGRQHPSIHRGPFPRRLAGLSRRTSRRATRRGHLYPHRANSTRSSAACRSARPQRAARDGDADVSARTRPRATPGSPSP